MSLRWRQLWLNEVFWVVHMGQHGGVAVYGQSVTLTPLGCECLSVSTQPCDRLATCSGFIGYVVRNPLSIIISFNFCELAPVQNKGVATL